MRVFISVDMEGVAGVVHVDQTRSSGQDFMRGRELMTLEANAAALGAFDAGATEVVINDSHGDMRNLLWEKLDPRVRFILGGMKPLSMCQGLDDGRFDAALYIGYHAGMGARAAILDHTYSGAVVGQVRINGRVLNETGLNALVAGHYGTPVALVTGDDACCREAKEQLGDVETVAVKWGITRYSAKSLHPTEAQRQIREAAARAVKNLSRFKPFTLPAPLKLEVQFLNSGNADNVAEMPGAVRVDPLTVAFTGNSVMDMFRALMSMLDLANAAVQNVRQK